MVITQYQQDVLSAQQRQAEALEKQNELLLRLVEFMENCDPTGRSISEAIYHLCQRMT